MSALPGWAIDLIHNGVRCKKPLTSEEVHLAMRRVMMSAHRNGVGWEQMYGLLTDTKRRNLARQIATGRGGTQLSPTTVLKRLRKHWDETARVVAERETFSRDDVLNIIEEVATALDASVLKPDHRKVMEAAITLARQHGTTRPALPVRVLGGMTGMSKSQVARALEELHHDGDWLRRAQRGDYKVGKASLYSLAPLLARTYTGATPPESRGVPKSHLPKSQISVASCEGEILVVTPEQMAAIKGLLAHSPSDGDASLKQETRRSVPLAKVIPLYPPPLAPELAGHPDRRDLVRTDRTLRSEHAPLLRRTGSG